MGKQETMKYRLAQAIRECMKTTPVDKITIREIVQTCGTTRQTFYRHFTDKYDLINWYFEAAGGILCPHGGGKNRV